MPSDDGVQRLPATSYADDSPAGETPGASVPSGARHAPASPSSSSSARISGHPRNHAAFLHNAHMPSSSSSPSQQPDSSIPPPVFGFHLRKPSAAGLHVQTELASHPTPPDAPDPDARSQRSSVESSRGHALLSSAGFPTRSGSLRSRHSLDDITGTFSAGSSAIPSPLLGALADVSPLPSPINRSGSPELWRKIVGRRRGSSGASTNRGGSVDDMSLGSASLLPPAAWPVSPRKKKAYPQLGSPSGSARSSLDDLRDRTRSISEFVPEHMANVRQTRNVTGPAASAPSNPAASQIGHTPPMDAEMHREEFRSGRKRKETQDPTHSLPSPPPSNRSAADSEDGDEPHSAAREAPRIIRVHSRSGRIHRWRRLRELGRGAFSEVVLATPAGSSASMDGVLEEGQLDSSQLVAIKVLTHDPSGGTEEERMETSIGREIEILKSISHPCLPRLLAFDDSKARAVLVLKYCPGGDLFELASQQREFLTPSLIQRIFAELVGAVRYLHQQYICHRDIKLENVLFDLPLSELPRLHHPQGLPHPLVTLTDMGLAKRIPRPPESPLLTHFCGSADYAAPELLLQQPYEGRSTDMWALGVLLYALVEGRLPFDPPPNARRAGNVKHRIARCDWMWIEYGDEDGEWLEEKGAELAGARETVENLLRKASRGRWSDEQTANHSWVQEGITTAGRVIAEGTVSPAQEEAVNAP